MGTIFWIVNDALKTLIRLHTKTSPENSIASKELREWSSEVLRTVMVRLNLLTLLCRRMVDLFGIATLFVHFPWSIFLIIIYMFFLICLEYSFRPPNDSIFGEKITQESFETLYLEDVRDFAHVNDRLPNLMLKQNQNASLSLIVTYPQEIQSSL